MDFKIGNQQEINLNNDNTPIINISKAENGYIINYTPKISLEDELKSKLSFLRTIKEEINKTSEMESEVEGDEWKKLLKDSNITPSKDKKEEDDKNNKPKTFIAKNKKELLFFNWKRSEAEFVKKPERKKINVRIF